MNLVVFEGLYKRMINPSPDFVAFGARAVVPIKTRSYSLLFEGKEGIPLSRLDKLNLVEPLLSIPIFGPYNSIPEAKNDLRLRLKDHPLINYIGASISGELGFHNLVRGSDWCIFNPMSSYLVVPEKVLYERTKKEHLQRRIKDWSKELTKKLGD